MCASVGVHRRRRRVSRPSSTSGPSEADTQARAAIDKLKISTHSTLSATQHSQRGLFVSPHFRLLRRWLRTTPRPTLKSIGMASRQINLAFFVLLASHLASATIRRAAPDDYRPYQPLDSLISDPPNNTIQRPLAYAHLSKKLRVRGTSRASFAPLACAPKCWT